MPPPEYVRLLEPGQRDGVIGHGVRLVAQAPAGQQDASAEFAVLAYEMVPPARPEVDAKRSTSQERRAPVGHVEAVRRLQQRLGLRPQIEERDGCEGEPVVLREPRRQAETLLRQHFPCGTGPGIVLKEVLGQLV